MMIHAAVLEEKGGPFSVEPLELDEPRGDEVLVRIHGVGLCHTDVVARDGFFGTQLPAVFGHEGAGVVEQVGPAVRKVKPGDRVVLTFLSCGHCPRCGDGEPAYCHTRREINYRGTRADGSALLSRGGEPVRGDFFGQSSFASHALAHERNTVRVDDDVPLDIAGALGCGVQTGAGAVMRSMPCRAGSTLVVMGGGPVGLSAVLGGVLQRCARIVLVEPHAARRRLALELGATQAIDPAEGDLVTLVKAVLPAAGADYLLDTSGVPGVIGRVAELLAPRGTFGFVGVPPASALGTPLPGTLVAAMGSGFTYRGIVEGDSDPDVFIPELIAHYRAGRFPFDRMVTRYPLADINRAVREQHDGLCVKAMLIP